MRKTTKRIVSLLCALSMVLTILGNVGFAVTYTADDVKAMLDTLIAADVNLDNWADNESDVTAAKEARDNLDEEQDALFVEMKTADDVLYEDILAELVLIVQTGPIYDAILALPQDQYDLTTGEWLEGVNADNYQDWYEAIVDLGLDMDVLTTEQQRLLGETILAIFATAAEELEFYWYDYVTQVASALVNVNTSNEEWANKTDAEKLSAYQTKRTQYEKTAQKVDALYVANSDNYKPDQLDDVNATLVAADINKTAAEILEEAKAYYEAIFNSSMEAIVAIVDEIAAAPVTIENCAEINAKAQDGLNKYAALEAATGVYWDELKDDALKASLEASLAESANWIDAKAFIDLVAEFEADAEEGITKDNYAELAAQYEVVLEKYNSLSGDEQALAPTVEAKAVLDTLKTSLDDFADAWIAEVQGLIDAIGTFDHATYADTEAWTALVARIDAAKAAVDEMNEKAPALLVEVDQDPLTNAKALKDEIVADYTAAGEVKRLISAIGTVGALATDDITLESGDKIAAAREAFDALTTVQQGLVDNASNLVVAEDEYTTLKDAKAVIEAYIVAFNTTKANVTYEVLDETDVNSANAAYEAAVAIADDAATYGTKLSALVATLKNDKVTFDGFVAAINDLKTKGDAFVDAIDAICALVDIRDEADLEGRLVAYAISSDAIAEMSNLFTEAATALVAYNAAVAESGSTYGEVPVEAVPYATYAADEAVFEVANELWGELAPAEQVAVVDEWVVAIETMFGEIEEKCLADLEATQAEYEALVEEYEDFEDIAKRYLYSNYLDILSKYDYIRIRIGQYADAAFVIATANEVTVPELPTAYDGATVDLETYKAGVASYKEALVVTSAAITNAYNIYNNSDQPTKEIAGVNEAYVAVQAKEAECATRNTALAFDEKVIVAANSFADELATNHTTYEEVLALEEELAGLIDAVKDAVTSEALLSDIEVDAVEDVIDAISTFTITDVKNDRDAIKAEITYAREAYDALDDAQKAKVENLDKLEAAEALLADCDDAIAFEEAVAALEDVTDANWETVKATAEALRAEYDGFNDRVKNLVANAYLDLQKKQAEVVSYMLSLIPDVETIRGYDNDDIDVIEEIVELLYAIDHVEADGTKAGAYRELTNYSKLIVVGYANYGVAIEELKGKLSDYNAYRADEVIALINAIDYYDANGNITMVYSNYNEYYDAIVAAEEAYDAYLEDVAYYQNVFGAVADYNLPDRVTNVTTLEAARADYDKFAAAEQEAADVIAMINQFKASYPTTDAVTNENYETVVEKCDAIEEAYEELSALAKKYVDITVLDAYREQAAIIARYMDVVEAIDALIYNEDGTTTSIYDDIVENAAFDVEYGVTISELEAQFEELTSYEKAQVYNYAILETARSEYDKNVAAAIQMTISKIDAIFEIAALEDFAKSTEGLFVAIEEASDWYDSLAVENQASVTNADKLAAAIEKYNALVDPSVAIAAIEALGNPEEVEITDENYAEISANVAAAREVFESLAQADKPEVTNLTTLTVWEEKLDGFEPDHSGDLNDDGVVTIDDISMMVDSVLRRIDLTEEQFERANIVVGADEQVIDIFDVLAAIALIAY